MNNNYKDYNIIPIGDHCAISIILKDLGLRNKSYPFDWSSHTDILFNTNIIYNIKIIDSLELDNISHITKEYIGDALVNINKIAIDFIFNNIIIHGVILRKFYIKIRFSIALQI